MLKTKQASLLIVLAILSFSTIMPALAYAQPLANVADNWEYVNGNSWGWNYSPASQFTVDNVDALEVKWVYPLQSSSVAPQAIQSIIGQEGSTTPPIVANGQVFVTSNFLRTYAIDTVTGGLNWVYNYAINVTDTANRLPIQLGGFLAAHLHGFRYWEAGNALLLAGMACDFYGIDVDTGDTTFWVQDLCLNIPGNLYNYRQGTVSQTNIGTYEEGNMFIYVLPGAMHSTAYEGDFRHTTIAVDMDTQQIIWRVFSYPPHGVPTQDWALQECDIGFFMDIPCSDVAASNPENLEWDWAFPGEPPSVIGGVTANWGEIIIDEDTGIIYTQTGNQGPYTYVGDTPGPRLYGSTIMAIDANSGQRVWWLQPFPRDPYDYDCNWSGFLANHPTLGQIYVKGCKEGRLYVMDAANGEPKYIVDVVDEQFDWGQIENNVPAEDGGSKYHLNDPFSFFDMREMISPETSYCDSPCPVYPFWFNGIFSTDTSYDPETGWMFHYAAALQTYIVASPPPAEDYSGSMSQTRGGGAPTNTTIVARDLATGEVQWTWYWDTAVNRPHLVVTPELVFASWIDGTVKFFNKETGTLLREMSLGSESSVGPTTGQDSDGNQMIFVIVGVGTSGIFTNAPGIVVGIGLNDRAQQQVLTTTVTTTTTTSTTLTSTSTSTTTATSTTTSATTTTVTSTSTSATTSTVTSTTTSATTSTVTTTGMASTTTVTSEVTEETGLPAEVTYAAIAVAVIAIIAA
ncbi:MAG: hypothetical protein ACXABY_25735, partial [Candidatus Thorarchaeota archaeon]